MNNKMICPTLFNNRVEAEIVLDKMYEKIDEFGVVTVADLYDLVGLNKDDTDSTYGWSNLRKADVSRVKNGYELQFPTPDHFGVRGQIAGLAGGSGGMAVHNGEYGSIVIPVVESEPENIDMVNHPQHYKSETGMEVIDVIEAFTFDLQGIEAVDTGNALKYICRWKKKNGVEDLKKAQWYLNHLIAHVEKMEKEND